MTPKTKLDFSGLADDPKPRTKPSFEDIRPSAEEGGFTTRHAPRPAEDPAPKQASKAAASPAPVANSTEETRQEPMRRGRKRTTNRNTPFAVKLKVETNNSIYQIAEELDCVIAEVIERAIDALEKKLAGEKR